MNDRVLEEFAGNLTVAELSGRTGRSIEDIVRFCSGGVVAEASSARRSSSTAMTVTAPAPSSTSAVETRTRIGRDAFDAALLGLLTGVQNGLSARDIAEETGASLPQIRSAVVRLGNKIRFKGNTAARRYWPRA